ncbi:hypothetical protein M413DRAFT_442416 [Hebeloma cylindrosporum]|uniref:BTB domain-containing protein n=1 Tax=Hebeloma cylindrosporum TaxID=76867 RepID=A0A0C3CK05_HEBCY|nr:hypothetical protein M413DRAFT_442416 [Hebeloma cylindrosporum h7]
MDMDGSSSAVVIHKQFNANVPGVDLVAQSSDGVVFHLHRKNLELYTDGAFPGLHNSVNRSSSRAESQIVRLDELSLILEIVFQFLYPRRQPSLKGLDFQTISAVADAVEKYRVFSAMNLCEEALTGYLEDQSMSIFLHALRYRRVNLANQSAVYLSRKPLLSVLDSIPPAITIPWLRYLEAWKSMFDLQLQKLEERLGTQFCDTLAVFSRFHPLAGEHSELCSPCFCSVTSWISLLQRMDKLSDLKAALIASIEPTRLSRTYMFNIPGSFSSSRDFSSLALRIQKGLCPDCLKAKGCLALPDIATRMLQNIEKLPPFTSFLNEDLDGEAVNANEED